MSDPLDTELDAHVGRLMKCDVCSIARSLLLGLTFAAAFIGLAAPHAASATLDDVRGNGELRCGVNAGLAGFSSRDAGGAWQGFDVDFCRAVAAAISPKPLNVEFVAVGAEDRFEALRTGKIDILARNSTWTLARDATEGINFVGVLFFDGQGFLVPRNLGISSALELSGASICVQENTTSLANLPDFFHSKSLPFTIVTVGDDVEMLRTFEMGRCNVLSSDTTKLHALRLKLSNPESHIILPEVISKEPLGPAVRHGDDQWLDVAKWTLFALLTGEELGLTRANVDQMAQTDDPRVRRFLGAEGALGQQLGLDNDWALRIVKQVGNYGEIYDANFGKGSPLNITRGMNGLWTEGGLHYAPPVR